MTNTVEPNRNAEILSLKDKTYFKMLEQESSIESLQQT